MKVLLYGYYGLNNLGDEYILYSMLYQLSSFKNTEITVISHKDGYEKIVEEFGGDIKIVVLPSKFTHKLLVMIEQIKNNNYFIVGGGGLFTSKSIKPLILYNFYFFLSKIYKTKCAIYGVDINSIDTILNQHMWKKMIDKVDFFSSRNVKSSDMLKHIPHIKAEKIFTFTDVTFGLPILKKVNITDTLELKKPYIIWAVAMPWSDIELYDPHYKKRYIRLCSDLAVVCRYWAENGYINLFVPFYDKRDQIINSDIISKVNKNCMTLNSNLSYHMDFYRELYKNAQFTISMRYHSILFSVYSQTPFTAISYSPKMSNFLSENNLSHLELPFGIRNTEFFYKEFDLNIEELLNKTQTCEEYREDIAKASLYLKKLAIDGKNFLHAWLQERDE